MDKNQSRPALVYKPKTIETRAVIRTFVFLFITLWILAVVSTSVTKTSDSNFKLLFNNMKSEDSEEEEK